jgi:hypothetical protein
MSAQGTVMQPLRVLIADDSAHPRTMRALFMTWPAIMVLGRHHRRRYLSTEPSAQWFATDIQRRRRHLFYAKEQPE